MIWYWVCSEDKLQSDLFKARCKLANQKTSSTDKLVFAPVFQWLQLQENEKIMKTNKQQKQQQPAYPKLSSDFTARIYKSLLKPRHFELWKGSLMSCWCKRISNVFSFLFSSFFCWGWRAGGGGVGGAGVSLQRLILFCTGSFAARRAGSPTKLRKCLPFTMWKHLVM